ncbi:penicillin-binding protein activator [Ectothiorhodospira mobilis]|uniref:penicillin-binding protein activator n=1 Tax=Ectothiorhodospira mobilis TaxID=195064 RepID=UPI001906B5BA|nr:penicillin-binding protein activator [Ectothiorhodospira mobilis]
MAPAPPADAPLLQEARDLASAGEYEAAARRYLEAAGETRGAPRAQLQLEALDLLSREAAGKEAWRQGQALAAELAGQELRGEDRARLALMQARIALHQDEPETALDLLPAESGELNIPLLRQVMEIRGRAQWAAGQWSGAVADLAAAAATGDETQRRRLAETLWTRLTAAPDQVLEGLAAAPLPPDARGWVRLAHLARDPAPRPRDLEDWRHRHPGHAAHPLITQRLSDRWKQARQWPTRVAVLLPLSGPLATAGRAIQEGITAAYFDLPRERRPRLEFHDTAGDAARAQAHYRSAVQAGAQWVIGPLTRAAVEELAAQQDLSVPTLALNHTLGDGPFPEDLYQFGLNPEDEARQVAERAILDGLQQAVILAPDTALGVRLQRAFETRFTTLGGVVREVGFYPATATDFEALIKDTLRIRPLPEDPVPENDEVREEEATPRYREDVDLIFLAGSPQQARLIRPQLRYHHAGTLPVMATSHVYSAQPDPRMDEDLGGILFADIPWVLEEANPRAELRRRLEETGTDSARRLPRLVALGFDALHLIPRMGELARGDGAGYEGLTGRLHMDDRGRVLRTLNWARFMDGRPQLLRAGTVAPLPLGAP